MNKNPLIGGEMSKQEDLEKKEMIEDANRLSSLTGEMAQIYKELKEGNRGEAEQKFKNILLEAEGFMSAIEAIGKKGEWKQQIQDIGDGFNHFIKEMESRSETINKVHQDYDQFKKKIEGLVRKLQ